MQDIKDKEMQELIRKMLSYIGEDCTREGLKDTPERMIRMYKEIYRGYDPMQKPKIQCFENCNKNSTEIICDSGDFYSMCEHHLMPFYGNYFFGYIPNPEAKILGLSKIARTVDYCSAKLQVQENLAQEIVDELWAALSEASDGKEAIAMGIIMEGEHLCKSMRGANKKGRMTTMAFKGAFKRPSVLSQYSVKHQYREDLRQEFLELYKAHKAGK